MNAVTNMRFAEATERCLKHAENEAFDSWMHWTGEQDRAPIWSQDYATATTMAAHFYDVLIKANQEVVAWQKRNGL